MTFDEFKRHVQIPPDNIAILYGIQEYSFGSERCAIRISKAKGGWNVELWKHPEDAYSERRFFPYNPEPYAAQDTGLDWALQELYSYRFPNASP